MYLSLDWLKDFVSIPKNITPEKLGMLLTTHTVEVDRVMHEKDKFRNVVIGKILEVKSHPNADKLRIAVVDVGKNIKQLDGKESNILKIVCGAPNIKAGQLVPVALVGAELPNGMKIKETKIRGIKSVGMLCAEDELGLGNDHSGILILKNGSKIGQNLSEYLKAEDVIYDVDNKSITHRPDLWSHYGIAREISVFLNTKLKSYPVLPLEKKDNKEGKEEIDVKVDSNKLCPRYMTAIIGGIEIKPSPAWISKRLIAAGQRPINNIVDITNYVMLELGQPLHAFDRNLVDKIIVRTAKAGEKIKTLDEEKRELGGNMLVIADSKKPIAIAGIMGGEFSEINPQTKSIILEAANFDFINIRETSAQLNLRTEASIRFEKSLDPNLCELAIFRAIELIKKVCPSSSLIGNIVDKNKIKIDQEPIIFELNWLNNFLGLKLTGKEIVNILNRLGFKAIERDAKISVIPPSWRSTGDISIREDIAEEIARIYDYNKIPLNNPLIKMKSAPINLKRKLEQRLRNILSGAPALTEVYNYSFVGEEQIKKLGLSLDNYVRLVNPASSNQTLLRQNLIPNLIMSVRVNQAKFNEIRIFEIGSIFTIALTGEFIKEKESKEYLPYQEKRLGIILATDKEKKDIFREIKGVISYFFSQFNLEPEFFPAEAVPAWSKEEGIAAEIKINGVMIGSVSNLDKIVRKKIGLKKNVATAEISLKELLPILIANEEKIYHSLPKFPSSFRDLAFVVDEKILYNDIKLEIINFHSYIKKVELFDEYHGGRLGEGKKNLAFHIIYQTDKTLKSKDVDNLQAGLIKNLEKKFGAKIRNF